MNVPGDGAFNPALIEKIRALSPERIADIEDFVDFLRARDTDRALTRAALTGSEAAFATIWSNPEDDAYDSH